MFVVRFGIGDASGVGYVRGGVVVSEDLEVVGLAADGDGGEEGEEVAGAAYGGLTDLTRRVRARGAIIPRLAQSKSECCSEIHSLEVT